MPKIHAIKLAEKTALCPVCFVSLQFEGKRPWKIKRGRQRNNQILRRLPRYTTVMVKPRWTKLLTFHYILKHSSETINVYSPLFTNSSKLDLQNWAVVQIARVGTRCPEMLWKNCITFLVLFVSLSCFLFSKFFHSLWSVCLWLAHCTWHLAPSAIHNSCFALLVVSASFPTFDLFSQVTLPLHDILMTMWDWASALIAPSQ